jgi:hypothetical protein
MRLGALLFPRRTVTNYSAPNFKKLKYARFQAAAVCGTAGILSCILGGGDPDDVFAYSTPKIVKIRDRRLGIINLFFKACIFFYVMLFAIWFKKEFITCYMPSVSSTMNLVYIPGLTQNECDIAATALNISYDGKGSGSTANGGQYLSIGQSQGYCADNYTRTCCGQVDYIYSAT